MAGIMELVKRMENLDPLLRGILYEILEEVERQREEARKFYVVREEFEDLKRVVRDLAERVRDLTEAVKELAEAQRRTEERVSKLEEGQVRLEKALAELAEAQRRTEERVSKLEERQAKLEEGQVRLEKALAELAEEQKKLAEAQRQTEEEIKKLTQSLRRTREEVGGLSRTMAYALENEAYRYLPAFLERRYGFQVEDRFVRSLVGDEEINFLARARVNGEEVYLVGETVLRLVSTAKFRQLRRKMKVVEESKGRRVIPFFVTHFAHPRVVERAKEAGIIVVQSFEWV